jgi:UDP:flavonoid glycosyltransferase YjiC (YdhE family)
LIPKPNDWGSNIDIAGFYFLSLASNYTPPEDLASFLAAGPAPVYIGFGSIVVDDPNKMTRMIFDAVRQSGQRALVSKGWGGLGADELEVPEGVFMLGNCPHDWLFQHVSCVVHHGGAGTTAAGIALGRPTVVIPFFGDQPFWGAMIARAGAGPEPIPYKDLDADKLAVAISIALQPATLEKARDLGEKIRHEKGVDSGIDSFYKHLDIEKMRCSLAPDRVAVFRVKRTDIRLSGFAVAVLNAEGLLDLDAIKL